MLDVCLWKNNSPHTPKYKALHEALVPRAGVALTTHGEVLRLVSNVYFDVYNNGGANLTNAARAIEWQAFVAMTYPWLKIEAPMRFSRLDAAFKRYGDAMNALVEWEESEDEDHPEVDLLGDEDFLAALEEIITWVVERAHDVQIGVESRGVVLISGSPGKEELVEALRNVTVRLLEVSPSAPPRAVRGLVEQIAQAVEG